MLGIGKEGAAGDRPWIERLIHLGKVIEKGRASRWEGLARRERWTRLPEMVGRS